MTDADRNPATAAPTASGGGAGITGGGLRVVAGAGARRRTQPTRDRPSGADDDLVERLALWLADVSAEAAVGPSRARAASARVPPGRGPTR